MLDLETWGTKPGCAIRSIGAAKFELTGEMGDTFYRNISDDSCSLLDLAFESGTVDWWAKRPPEATSAFADNQESLAAVVGAFHEWINGALFVWSQGANFDEPIWRAAAERVNWAPPWKYWNVRDTRTIYHFARFDPRSMKRDGTHHHALNDALFQIKCVQECYRRLHTLPMTTPLAIKEQPATVIPGHVTFAQPRRYEPRGW